MNTELKALLIVQQDDEVIRAIEARRDALAPRLATLDKARKRAADEVSRTEGALERELEKHRAIESRLVDHRIRHDKNVEVLNSAQKLKEVTAAAAQVEAARKMVADEESESLIFTDGSFLPPRIRRDRFLGQKWSDFGGTLGNYGAIAKAKPAGLDIIAGIFRSYAHSDEEHIDLLFGTQRDGSVANRVVVVDGGMTIQH